MPAGFHPYAHLLSLRCQIAIKLFCSLTVLYSLLSTISSFGIDKRYLLEARVIIASYNNHRRLLSTRAFGWSAPPNLTRVREPALLWNQLWGSASRLPPEGR